MLLLSLRRIEDLVAFCLQYELEDVAAEITDADRVDVGDRAALELARRGYRLARALTRSRSVALAAMPRPATVRLEREYDLFFPVFNNAYELFALAAVPSWRARCRVAACFIDEIWLADLPDGYLLELLSDFDHIFVGTQNAIAEVSRRSGRPCTYLPLAVDVLRFSPVWAPVHRSIDVCYIGRRSHVTHEALLRLSRERALFYYYDTVAASGRAGRQRTFRVESASEHRELLAGLLKRTRYFVANRALVNEAEHTRGCDEISGRFYEGAAAGAVLVGEAPRGDEFARQFPWQDAVIPLPFDSPNVAAVLGALDREPERLARIAQENARNAALRHDWAHRMRTVFATLGLTPTPAMIDRERRLRTLAVGADERGDGDEGRRRAAMTRQEHSAAVGGVTT